MVDEARFHDQIMYITLTYDNEHIEHTNLETGEITPDLSKRDAQLFLKRLRKQIEKTYHKKIRYYLCGEYGGQTGRPHYHAILFGIGLTAQVCNPFSTERIQYKDPQISKANVELKKIVQEAWDNGRVDFDDRRAGQKACEYVAKYIQKFDTRSIPESWQPEFSLFSKGLGRKWIEKYGPGLKNELHPGKVLMLNANIYSPAPKYYLDKIFTKEELKVLKEKDTPEYLKILQAHEKNGSGLPSVIASAEREKEMVKMQSDIKLNRMQAMHKMFQRRRKI
jgi:hypothetical protein